jgi:hypothetical protein
MAKNWFHEAPRRLPTRRKNDPRRSLDPGMLALLRALDDVPNASDLQREASTAES